MYKIIKISENDIPIFIVMNSLTKREVARYNTYQEAVLDMMSR
jgi:hypothetical protein